MHKQEKTYIAAPRSIIVTNFMYILQTSAVKASESSSNRIHSLLKMIKLTFHTCNFHFMHFQDVFIQLALYLYSVNFSKLKWCSCCFVL